ncbi:MAG: CHAT domain-containing protein, partial [Myxococcales bacterium]|nr:CHAT domain-containing protein [Myxococcales bacterium]
HAEAAAGFGAVVEIGRAAGIEEIELAGQLELGNAMIRQGSDLSRVRALYDEVVPRALERASYPVGTKALVARALLWRRLGKTAEQRQDYETLRERARAHGNAYDELFAEAELLSMELGAIDLRDGGVVPPELRARLDQARRHAEATEQSALAAYLRCMEADLLARAGRAEEAAASYERCAAAYERAQVARGHVKAQSWQALMSSQAGDHARAQALARQADERARALGLRETWLQTGFVLVVAAMNAGDLRGALEQADRHFDDIELYREIQGDMADRSRELSGLSSTYYLVSGKLLAQPERTPTTLDAAFAAIERMRARNLLDGLRRSNAMRPDPDDPDEVQWQEVVAEIAAVQQTLLLPALGEAQRRAELQRLEQLEAHERRLRTALAAGPGELGTLLAPELPKLAEVQAALGEREAILSYQLADVFDDFGAPEGGAWLWVITRDAVQVHPLPERRVLERALAFVDGLFARRDARELEAMVRLHGELVAPALESLPAEVDRLVIVPDGALWSLPFAALRSAPDAAPLVSRYATSLSPSVTSWMRWGAREHPVAPGLLALAQPQLDAGSAAAVLRQGTLASGLELGALPRAQQEVEAIVRIWGPGQSDAEIGSAASERFLKGSDLSRYGLLHFATHAVMDPAHPDRSAVVLAAGGEQEDGLLQAREIVRLPLRGKVVVIKFFAKYCEPCKETLPAAEKLHQQHPEVAFVGISEDEYPSDAQALIDGFGLSFPVVHDQGNVLAGRFRVSEMPVTFVVDAQGVVQWVGGPGQGEKDLAAAISAYGGG